METKVKMGDLEISHEATDKEAIDFLNSIVPDFIKDGIGILSDNVKLWRWKNQIKIISEAKKFINENNLSIKQTSLKILIPIIESSSLEEDETIQKKWSILLAKAISGDKNIKPSYVETLKELSSLEVYILDSIFQEVNKESDEIKRSKLQFSTDKVIYFVNSKIAANLNKNEAKIIIENLFRLNLLRAPASGGISAGEYSFVLRTNDFFELTDLGYDFIKSCNK